MKNPSDTAIEIFVLVLFLGIILAISFGVNCCNSRLEARAYNRVTGANVSWWDAMWIDLRAEAPAK